MKDKREHDLDVLEAIEDIQDKECLYNTVNRKKFVEHEHVVGVLLEEISEAREGLEEIESLFLEYVSMVRNNCSTRDLNNKLLTIKLESTHCMQELCQVGSICTKARLQLGGCSLYGDEK